jgi:hypothetical protein
MSDNPISATELSSTGVNYVTAMVQKALIERAVVMPYVMNASSLLGPGALSVSIPRITNFTVANKVEGTANDYLSVTASVDTLTVNLHKRIVMLVEDYAVKQSVVDWNAELASKCAAAIALQMDTDVITALLDGYTSSNPDHYVESDGFGLTIAKLNNSSYLLNAATAPRDGRFIIINPLQEKEMLNLDNIIQAQQFGTNQPLTTGFVGTIFGMPVLSTTACTANKVIVAHREAVAWALQGDVTWKSQENIKYGGMDYAMSADYGVKVLNGGRLHVVTLVN